MNDEHAAHGAPETPEENWDEVFPESQIAPGPLDDAPPEHVLVWNASPVADRAEWILQRFPPEEWFTEFAFAQWAEAWADPVLWLRLKRALQEVFIKGADFEAAVLAGRHNHSEACAPWQRPTLTKGGRPPGLSAPSREQFLELPPLRCDAKDRPYPDAGNFRTIFTHYPPWAGTLWWEDFSQRPMLEETPLDDQGFTNAAAWCGDALGMSVRSEDQLRRSLVAVAQGQHRDVLQEYVESLVWDRTPRLETWLSTYAGASPTRTVALTGTSLCCALVARALTPGCLQRLVVILEGPD